LEVCCSHVTLRRRREPVAELPFAESVDDYVDENNPVRAVEVFVDALTLAQLGFSRAVPAETGRPSYHPSTMLKIYLYGYLNTFLAGYP
jgi:transposase